MGCTFAVYSGSPLSGSVATRSVFDCRMLSFGSLLFTVFVEGIHDIVQALVYEIAVAPHILGKAAVDTWRCRETAIGKEKRDGCEGRPAFSQSIIRRNRRSP